MEKVGITEADVFETITIMANADRTLALSEIITRHIKRIVDSDCDQGAYTEDQFKTIRLGIVTQVMCLKKKQVLKKKQGRYGPFYEVGDPRDIVQYRLRNLTKPKETGTIKNK